VLGLVFLTLAVLPLGLVLLRVLEWFLGHRIGTNPPERLLIALYGSGGLLFVMASIPLPIFGAPLVVALLAVGAAALGTFWFRERWSGIRLFLRWATGVPALLLGAVSLGLLVLEVSSVASLPFTNTYDGANHALFANLILRNHTLPWTLAPFANMGVEYPQGAPVWETLPTLLMGWPILAGPVLLPALFLSLTPVAAFCLGTRLNNEGPVRDRDLTGLLFAGFFGLVAAWPRLFVGGSYDFVFALPLFILTLGWIAPLTRITPRPWRDLLAFGALVGTAATLSETVGIELLLLAGSFWFASAVAARAHLRAVAGRWLVTSAVAALFLSRSIAGFILWSGYPGYILSPVGSTPYAILPSSPPSYRSVTGELDPFLLWKYKLSPFASVSLLLAVLLAIGLVLPALRFLHPGSKNRFGLPGQMVHTVLIGTMTSFAATALILAASVDGFPISIQILTNVEEFSIVLFIFFELIALLPLVASLHGITWPSSDTSDSPIRSSRRPRSLSDRPTTAWATGGTRTKWVSVVAVGFLLVTFGLGAGTTIVSAPTFIYDHVQDLANVSPGDIAALEWAGGGLPGCSRVLVAPGSVAEYLPEYSSAQVVFPAFPSTYNLSYVTAIGSLTAGVYNGSVRADLVQLGVTEVFVTGQNTAEFPAIPPAPLEADSDFSIVFHVGDAFVFEFLTGVALAGCPP
jgi:hypothetical protein